MARVVARPAVGSRQDLAPVEVDEAMALIEKGQQLAGHFPDADALGRARRVLEGQLSGDDAMAEIRAKYGR